MFCIFLLHVTGGGMTCIGESEKICIERCKRECEQYPKNYILATMPYRIAKNNSMYNTSVPQEILDSWHKDELQLYFNI